MLKLPAQWYLELLWTEIGGLINRTFFTLHWNSYLTLYIGNLRWCHPEEPWQACTILMQFKTAKSRVLHPSQRNPQCQYRLGDEWIASGPAELAFGRYWWMKNCIWAGNVCLQPRRPIVSWATSKISRWSFRFFPTQTILWFFRCFQAFLWWIKLQFLLLFAKNLWTTCSKGFLLPHWR